MSACIMSGSLVAVTEVMDMKKGERAVLTCSSPGMCQVTSGSLKHVAPGENLRRQELQLGLGQITADKAPVFESCGDAQTKILHVLLAVHPSGYEVSDIIHVPVRFVLYS